MSPISTAQPRSSGRRFCIQLRYTDRAMCGRFGFSETGLFPDRFEIDDDDFEALSLEPRYNAAPGQDLPVVYRQAGRTSAALMRWGLVPSWAPDAKAGYKTINARVETAAVRPAFRDSLRARRCLIPAGWFYEWKQVDDEKIPHVIRRNDQALFAMAGLYDIWRDPQGQALWSFTILTSGPNRVLREIHDRMPLMLPRELEKEWLTSEKLPWERLTRVPMYPNEDLETYPVSRLVNAVRNDSPDLIRPVDPATAPRQGSLF